MRETSEGFRLRDLSDYYSLDEIENYNTQKANDKIEEINSKMMSGTNDTDNQLANRQFVNSSITHNAAYFRGNWGSWANVPTDPNLYPVDTEGNKKPTNNDYLVLADMTGYVNPDEPTRTYEGTWRFKYIGEWDDEISEGVIRGKNGWKPEYQVNEKPLTAEQLLALNSGINQTKVTNYDAHLLNTTNPHNVTKNQVGLGKVDNTSDLEKPISTATQDALDDKVDIDQNSTDEGKVLGIVNGKVTPVEMQGGGATPEQLATKLDKTEEIKKIKVVTEVPSVKDLYTLYFIVEDDGDWPGLKLTSNTANSTIAYTIVGNTGAIDKDIYTSSDGKTWSPWDGSNITLNNGEYRYIWNKKNTLSNEYATFKFAMSGSIAASGNCDSMINFSELSNNCYEHMFANCTVLTTPPALPSTTLAKYCYYLMFGNCTALTTPPELPATTLAEGCYQNMFEDCTSLTTPPILPAITLSNNCYTSMFVGCESLTSIELPATTLAEGCYKYLFGSHAYSLTSIKLAYTGNFDQIYFDGWTYGVSSSGTFYYNGSDTTRGASAIPQNWAVQTF